MRRRAQPRTTPLRGPSSPCAQNHLGQRGRRLRVPLCFLGTNKNLERTKKPSDKRNPPVPGNRKPLSDRASNASTTSVLSYATKGSNTSRFSNFRQRFNTTFMVNFATVFSRTTVFLQLPKAFQIVHQSPVLPTFSFEELKLVKRFNLHWGGGHFPRLLPAARGVKRGNTPKQKEHKGLGETHTHNQKRS